MRFASRSFPLVAVAISMLGPAPARAGGAAPTELDGELEGSIPGEVISPKDITATASSTLCEKKPKLCHGPEALFDDNMATAWCEGLPGDGAGATITLTFAHPEQLTGFFLVPHFAKSFALAEQNNRLKTIELTTDAETFTVALEDVVARVKKQNGVHEVHDPCGCGDETCMSRDDRIKMDLTGQYVGFGAPVKTTKLVITLRDVYRGTRFHDTCASMLTLYRAK